MLYCDPLTIVREWIFVYVKYIRLFQVYIDMHIHTYVYTYIYTHVHVKQKFHISILILTTGGSQYLLFYFIMIAAMLVMTP